MALYACIIDDNRDTAEGLAKMLRLLKYESQITHGPATAFEMLAQRVPDVIFLDIHMQGADGVEVCRVLRRDPRTAQVPIIAISSDTQRSLVSRVRSAGADGFLPKPLEFDALEGLLRRVAARAHRPGEPASPRSAASPRPPTRR